MKEESGKYLIILFLWVSFGGYLWWCYKESQFAEAVEENGVEVRAKIIERFYAKGWTAKIEYNYNGKRYTYSGVGYEYNARKPGFIPRVGDSLIIKILPKEPDKYMLVKKIFFSIPQKP